MSTTDHVKVNTSAYPDAKRTILAMSTLNAVKKFLAQPGGKEVLDEEIKVIQAERAAKTKGAKEK